MQSSVMIHTFFSRNFWASRSPSANPVMDVSDLVRIGCVSSRLMYAAHTMPSPLAGFFSPSSLADEDAPSGGSLLFPPSPPTPPPPMLELLASNTAAVACY